jgi:hypothetical protein
MERTTWETCHYTIISFQWKPDAKPISVLLAAWYLLGLLFNPEDGGSKYLRKFRELLPHCMTPHSLLSISSNLKMQIVLSSETSVNVYRSTRRHVPRDNTVRSHSCENIRSDKQRIPWRRMWEWRLAPPFLTSALDGGEWSASQPGRLTLGEIDRWTNWVRSRVGRRIGLDAMKKRKMSCPFRESIPGRPAHSPSPYRLNYPSFETTRLLLETTYKRENTRRLYDLIIRNSYHVFHENNAQELLRYPVYE